MEKLSLDPTIPTIDDLRAAVSKHFIAKETEKSKNGIASENQKGWPLKYGIDFYTLIILADAYGYNPSRIGREIGVGHKTIRHIVDRPGHPAHALTEDDRQIIIADLVASGKRPPDADDSAPTNSDDDVAPTERETHERQLAAFFSNRHGIIPTLGEIFIAVAQHFDQQDKHLTLFDSDITKSREVSSKIRNFHAFIAHKFYGFSFGDIAEATGQTGDDVAQAYEHLTTALTSSRHGGAYIETDIIAIAGILRNYDRSFLNLPASKTAEQIRAAEDARLIDTPYVKNLRTTNPSLYNNVTINLPEMQAGSFAKLFASEYGHYFQPNSVIALLEFPGFDKQRGPRSLSTYNRLVLRFLKKMSASESPRPNGQAARRRAVPARQPDTAEHR